MLKHTLAALLASTALATPVLAHQSCGHPGQPACADGWRSPEMTEPPGAPGVSDKASGRYESPTRTDAALNGVQGACSQSTARVLPERATEPEMRAWCAELVVQDLLADDPTNACVGWISPLTTGVLPTSAGSSQNASVGCKDAGGSAIEAKAGETSGASAPAPGASQDASGASWSEEFNGNSLSGWVYGDRWMGKLNPDGQAYIDFASPNTTLMTNPANAPAGFQPASVKDGVLTLTARRLKPGELGGLIAHQKNAQNVPNAPVTWQGAQITPVSGDINPGDYVESRLRISPYAAGIGGAFWLYDSRDGGTQEVDIADMVGDGQTVYTHLHDGKGTGEGEVNLNVNPSEWHTYGLQYDTGKISTYVDGKLVGTQTGAAAAKFTGPMHPLLSIGGDLWNKVPSHINEAQMQVDYVRVYRGGPPVACK